MNELIISSPVDGDCSRNRISEEIDGLGASLRIITNIERGYGVVPVLTDGAALLKPGEVAVYKEERPGDLVHGLYCLERQSLRSYSPRADTPRNIEREVVYVRRSTLRGVSQDCWEYISLESRIIRGVRRYPRPEGPLAFWALGEMLLGPIVGIYLPNGSAAS